MNHCQVNVLKIIKNVTQKLPRIAGEIASSVTSQAIYVYIANDSHPPLVGYSALITPTRHRSQLPEMPFPSPHDFPRALAFLYCSALSALGRPTHRTSRVNGFHCMA